MYTDIEYLHKISPLLPLFKHKGNNTFNSRCVICGDSQRNKYKTRLYIFPSTCRSQLIVKCHNCGYSHNFHTFLKQVGDRTTYNQYQMAKFKNNFIGKMPSVDDQQQGSNNQIDMTTDSRLIDKLLDRVDRLPSDHQCVQYCIQRSIPRARWNDLYYIENIGDIEQLSEKYRDRIVDRDSRLVIPIFDRDSNLGGVTCRSLDPQHPRRYVMIKVRENSPMIFGLDRVDFSKRIYCVEGPIDSLFLPNSIAINNADFRNVDHYVPKQMTTIILDNQPKNKEIVSMYRKVCERGYSVFIWPQKIEEKDVNELITSSNMTFDQLMTTINTNTFSNLALKLAIENWRKI